MARMCSSQLARPAAESSRRIGLLWLAAAAVFLVTALTIPRTGAGGESAGPAPGTLPDLEALQDAFQQVVAQVEPCVVGIRAQRCQVTHLPGVTPNESAGIIEQRIIVNGSGTILSADGLVLTNEHVVQAATEIVVLLYDGSERPATVVQTDPRSDLAVLRINQSGLTPARFCEWETVARGQWTIVLGNPYGLGGDGQLSMAVGIVSNLGRQLPGLGEVDDRFYNDMIQTTAPINPGHSGGPLFNIRGELIGIVTAMHTRAPADEGIGFAIPMSPAKRHLIETLCDGQRIAYGYLGLTVRVPETEDRRVLNLPDGHGVLVQQIEPDGPAAQAGVQLGDLIRTFDDQPVTGPGQLAELVGQTPVGTEVPLELWQADETVTVIVTIGQRDVSRVHWMRGQAVNWQGLSLTDLTADARRGLSVDAGAQGVAVVSVCAASVAGQASIEVGDVITAVAGQPVHSTGEFLQQVGTSPGPWQVSLHERGMRFIPQPSPTD